jgi:hypothetical protein
MIERLPDFFWPAIHSVASLGAVIVEDEPSPLLLQRGSASNYSHHGLLLI